MLLACTSSVISQVTVAAVSYAARCAISVAEFALVAGVADAPMETEPSPIELAAQALRTPGTVRYWTDFLKVRSGDALFKSSARFLWPDMQSIHRLNTECCCL